MDLLKDDIKKCFFRYLSLTFFGSCIASVYGLVDLAMVGNYHGYLGSSAMALVMPVFNIVYSFGLLAGVGGATLYSLKKGREDGNYKVTFTSSIIYALILSFLAFIIIYVFDDELLIFFGGDKETFPLAKEYLSFLKFFTPFFVINQLLGAFLRNDNNPQLATLAILIGGIINIVGDYVLIFTFDMGIKGAGLATSLCQVVSIIIMLTHFFTKKNTLKLEKPKNPLKDIVDITKLGFGAFIVDFAVGIITVLFNRQIMKYCNNSYLSIYGVLINVAMFVQCTAYAIGQSSQPIISINKGANKNQRVLKAFKLGMLTSLIAGLFWFVVVIINPNFILGLFMELTNEIKSVSNFVTRIYSISFIFLTINIYLTYYFQSIEKNSYAFIISCLRGFVISGLLILILPLIFDGNVIWYVIPMSELITLLISIYYIKKSTLQITKNQL